MGWKDYDVVDQRHQFVLRALAPGANMSKLCEEFGISRRTGYKWRDRFCDPASGGPEALKDRSRKPRTSPREISTDLALEIVRLRQCYGWGGRKLRTLMKRANFERVPCERTIDRVLKKAGLLKETRRRVKGATPAPEPAPSPEKPNDLWTVDFKGWWKTGDSTRCEPLTIRDAWSRYILEIHVSESCDLKTTQKVFEEAFQRYGLPKGILSDNGSPFACTRALGGLSKLSAYWLALGITPFRIRPGKPQENGAHERMHRDMKAELQLSPAADRKTQQVAVDDWRLEFNNVRPHEALDLRTPSELYMRSSRIFDGQKPVLVYPAHYEVRRVRSNGSIKYKQRHCFVSEALSGWDIALEVVGDRLQVRFAERVLGTTDLGFVEPIEPLPEEKAE